MRLKPPCLGPLHLLADPTEARRVHHLLDQCLVLDEILNMGRVERIGDDLGQPHADLRPLAVADGFDEEIPKRAALELNLPQDVEHLALEALPGLLDLVEQGAVRVAFAGIHGHEVPQVADLGLADTVDPPESLLDPVWIPREVVVDHQVGPLEVDPFPGRIGGDQHVNIRVVQEGFLSLPALFAAHPAVDRHHGIAAPKERGDPLFQVGQGIAVLAEDDELLAGEGTGLGTSRAL